jgi:ppGpp synthetase/RelA/SpoT-type nucleotidyltranferase
MNEAQVKNKFSSRKVELEIWGNYIKKFVLESLTRLNINHEDFLKIPPKVRVKDEQSFLEKAFHRFGKNYSNPLVEITDQVGIRFVVLLESSITILSLNLAISMCEKIEIFCQKEINHLLCLTMNQCIY